MKKYGRGEIIPEEDDVKGEWTDEDRKELAKEGLSEDLLHNARLGVKCNCVNCKLARHDYGKPLGQP